MVGGCGGDSGQTGSSSAPSSTAHVSTEPGVGLRTASHLTRGETYKTNLFTPGLTVTVPRGEWATEQGDSPRHISFASAPSETLAQAIVALHRIDRVFDANRGGRIPGDQVPLRGSFADWLRHHPYLRVTRDQPVTMFGLRGSSLDIVARKASPRGPEQACGDNGRRWLPLFYDGLDYVIYGSSSRGRFNVLKLPSGGELVVEEFVQPGSAFREGLAVLRPMIRAIRLRVGA